MIGAKGLDEKRRAILSPRRPPHSFEIACTPLISAGYRTQPCANGPERSVKSPPQGGENTGTGVLDAVLTLYRSRD